MEQIENQWIRKLDCLDEVHTNYTNLSIKEGNKLARKLKKFADSSVEPPCTDEKNQVFLF